MKRNQEEQLNNQQKKQKINQFAVPNAAKNGKYYLLNNKIDRSRKIFN